MALSALGQKHCAAKRVLVVDYQPPNSYQAYSCSARTQAAKSKCPFLQAHRPNEFNLVFDNDDYIMNTHLSKDSVTGQYNYY